MVRAGRDRANIVLVATALGAGLVAASCGSEPHDAERVRGQAEAPQRTSASPPAPPTPPPPRDVDCTRLKCVALTFDDGPGPHTARLLDDLRRTGARATFFLLGQNVPEFPGQVRRMAMEGHELANHTWSHPTLTGLSDAAVRKEIARTQEAIRKASGGVVPTVFRPPYGATNERVAAAVDMPEILWSVDTLDWKHRNASRVARVAKGETASGGIVLMHDIHESTVDAVPEVVNGLKRDGYTPVTITELFGEGGPEKGRVHNEREMPPAEPPAPSAGPSGGASGDPSPGVSPPPASPPASPPEDVPGSPPASPGADPSSDPSVNPSGGAGEPSGGR